MAKADAGNGWTRQEVNVRLSKPRLALLRALAKRMPEGATPTEVLDHALALALEGSRGIDGRLDAMEDSAIERDMQRRFEIDRVEDAVKAVAERLDALARLIERAASDDSF